MDHSDAIEKYIHKKLEKLDKFFKRDVQPVFIEMTLQGHREKHCCNVAFKINSIEYHNCIHMQGQDIYAMIDEALIKMIKDMARKKEKWSFGYHIGYSL